MRLRHRMIIYLVGLHAVFFGLVLCLFNQRPVIVLMVELLIVVSVITGLRLIEKAVQPFEYTRQFRDLMLDKNYAARLREASDTELLDMVALFNSMLDALYQERIKLGEQRGFLDRLLGAIPSAVIVFDFDMRISLLNASAEALFQLQAPEGKTLSQWLEGNAVFAGELDDAARKRVLSLLGPLQVLPIGESQLLSDADGRRYWCQRNQFFDRGFSRDFLLIEEVTAELLNSEKAMYEKLIRVLAHEVNNTVAATGSVLESLLFYRDQLQESDGIDFQTAIAAVRRRNSSLGEFIERFTRVVKMPEPELRPVQLVDILNDIMALYREQSRRLCVNIEWTRCDNIEAQQLDSHLIQQALMNIIKNAMEAAATTALQSGAAGYVHIELTQMQGQIKLSVIDSGNLLGEVPPGQLFTPFFTTKKGGQGIGLLFVREVLARHGFAYRLAASGRGETCFDIHLDSAA